MTLLSGTLLSIPFYRQEPLNGQQSLAKVFSECAQQVNHASSPNLPADWAALLASVNKAPWVIPAKASPTHQLIVFDSDQLASSVHQLLFDAGPTCEHGRS